MESEGKDEHRRERGRHAGVAYSPKVRRARDHLGCGLFGVRPSSTTP
jgi:hypothetical protein